MDMKKICESYCGKVYEWIEINYVSIDGLINGLINGLVNQLKRIY